MTRLRVGSLALPLLLGVTLLAACGEEPDSSAQPTSSASPSESPSESASASASGSPSASAPLPDGPLATRFIDPAELPGFNDEWRWKQVSSGPSSQGGFGRCARFDLLTIGATEALTRTYAEARPAASSGPPTTTTAAMQLVQFADTNTARRAAKVLESWHDSCAERIRPRLSPQVGDLQDVDVPADSGSWYLVVTSRPNADEGHFHAFGMTVSGDRMALLTMDNDGQDRNYEPGDDPMERAVAMAADRIR